MLPSSRYFRLESTLEFIKINCKVVDVEEDYVAFRVSCNVWMIPFIHENLKDTSNSAENIIESKFHKSKKFRLVVLLVVIIYSEVLFQSLISSFCLPISFQVIA